MNKDLHRLPISSQSCIGFFAFREFHHISYKINHYNIAQPKLEYLGEKVWLLKQLTEEICLEKIREIGNDNIN